MPLSCRWHRWVGITDRGFQRENLFGAVTVVDNTTRFAGAWGAAGAFSTVRRCTARTDDVGVVQTGDVWQGYYVCDAAASEHDEEDVYTVSLAITDITSQGDVSAIVSVATENGAVVGAPASLLWSAFWCLHDAVKLTDTVC